MNIKVIINTHFIYFLMVNLQIDIVKILQYNFITNEYDSINNKFYIVNNEFIQLIINGCS